MIQPIVVALLGIVVFVGPASVTHSAELRRLGRAWTDRLVQAPDELNGRKP
ncbi:MAG: hypothetical protein IT486_08210 [Gammaproteobacteria bacterium]|nr:hypothetical protein [Gammaproteobacteria bacterium]